MKDSIKKKTVKGLLWSGIEKMAYEIIQFVIGIVLARLLSPDDYGTIGLITVFITFSKLFIDGGLTTALIQKKNRTRQDFNTVFFFNLGMSLFLYAIIFLIAPIVESFYEKEQLTSLLRILSLVLIISPFATIQITQLTIDVNFKTISLVSIPAALFSGIVGVVMAYKGTGPYALVGQQISMILVRSILVNIVAKYKIHLSFSKESFKDLFSFSYKLVLSSSLDRIYNSIYTLVIGKVFTPATLGLYTRGTQFVNLTTAVLGDVFNRVTFPVMSSVQDDTVKLKSVFQKYISGSSFLIVAALFCLLLAAEPLILILLTEKWIEAVPIMQIMCLAYLTDHVCTINRNLLYTKKRSDLALRLEFIKKTLALLIFLVSIKFGIFGVCWGQVLYGIVATILNSYYSKKLVDYGIMEQFYEYGKMILFAIVSSAVPYAFMHYFVSPYLQIIFVLFSFIVIYVLLNGIFQTYPYMTLKQSLSNRFLK